jgi:hypothetical protein
MSTRFVLIANETVGSAKRNAVSSAIKSEGAGWWHWFQFSWIIKDPHGRDTRWWRDRLGLHLEPNDFVILGVANPSDWAGFGMNDRFGWFFKTWPDN